MTTNSDDSRAAHVRRGSRRLDRRVTHAWAGDAELYERGRPGFPHEAVAIAMRGLGLAQGARVLDLAAGTGRLTRALVSARLSPVAVEPLESMRAVFSRACPDVTVAEGTAEAIPLADGSVEAVFVGQAIHWFDVPVACCEIGRVLRPGGGLALLRNDWPPPEQAPAWLAELRTLLGSLAPGEEPSRAPYGGRWREALAESSVFGEIETASVEHTESRSVEGVLSQIASWSHFDTLESARPGMLREMELVLRAHAGPEPEATIRVPYRTTVWWARRAASS